MTGRYNIGDTSLTTMIADLIKRVEKLEAGNRISYTSIDSGALNVANGSLTVGNPFHVFFGPVAQGPGFTPGWIFRRANLNNAFTLSGNDDETQYWALYDDSNNIIAGDDAATGQGLARPYIPIPRGVHFNKTFPITTTSATFDGMWIFRFKKQHPTVYIDPLIKCSDGTTGGEYQIVDNVTGNAISDPVTIPNGTLGRIPVGPLAVDGAHMADMELEFQARRTAGAGTIGVEIYNAYGRQT